MAHWKNHDINTRLNFKEKIVMDIVKENEFALRNLGKINVILGKNGCGKSTLLKNTEKYLFKNQSYGKIKYITPERGGALVYDPSVEMNMANNTLWLFESRRKNQFGSFRQQSIAQFRHLELLFYREMELDKTLREDFTYTFDRFLDKINELLDNIEIRREQALFKIYKKTSNIEIKADSISSGESELISLGIECLVFEKECLPDKPNILFLDEPDVHLHPDLQARLSCFLRELVDNKNTIIILATHSTAILGALEEYDGTYIEFLSGGQKELNFKKVSDEYRKILPVFGAHPLSNLFNQTPILLVEGDDDERIWQQAVRSSNKKLKIYPCPTDGEGNMARYEQEVEQIISSVYDNAKAFSLRDRDEGEEAISDLKIIKRFKLSCRASENLLLTNEVLVWLGISWEELKQCIDRWIELNVSHPHHAEMLAFKESNYDRKNFDLKNIRNDLMHVTGKSMAWEVAVGKTIGKLISEDKIESAEDDSIFCYLGNKLVSALLN